MNPSISGSVGAMFKLIVRSADEHIVQESDWSKNMVLDSGLRRMSAGRWIDRCCVGSGNEPVSSIQTALQSFVASSQNSINFTLSRQVSNAPFYLQSRQTWRFAQGVATGILKEIGLGWGDSNLWNRALIRGLDQLPTTITVGPNDILDVVAVIRFYPAVGQGSFSLRNEDRSLVSSHTYNIYPFLGLDPSDSITFVAEQVSIFGAGNFILASDGAITPAPLEFTNSTYSESGPNSLTNSYPTPTSCKVNAIYERGFGNNVPHRSFLLYVRGILTNQNHLGFKWQIDPPISKTDFQTLQYSLTVTWQRYG